MTPLAAVPVDAVGARGGPDEGVELAAGVEPLRRTALDAAGRAPLAGPDAGLSDASAGADVVPSQDAIGSDPIGSDVLAMDGGDSHCKNGVCAPVVLADQQECGGHSNDG